MNLYPIQTTQILMQIIKSNYQDFYNVTILLYSVVFRL
jgi:hypothetical protein